MRGGFAFDQFNGGTYMLRHFPASTICSLALVALPALAADNQSPVSTTGNSSDRYEIIQSELAAKNTFRVDRFCGSVSELVVDDQGLNHWQNMPIDAKPACMADCRPHYQLFTSGLAIKFSFLMNTASGMTWLLVVDDKSVRSWELMH